MTNGHVYPQLELTQGQHQTGFRQPFLLFRNLGDGTFEEISREAALRSLPLASRRGAAFGDLNNDGRVDVVIVNLGEAPSVLLNTSENQNQSVSFRLIQTKGNREAIGVRLTLRTSKHSFIQEVQAGASYLSQNDLRLHFGVGANETIKSIEVRWTNGETETVAGVVTGRMITITQRQGITASVPYRDAQK